MQRTLFPKNVQGPCQSLVGALFEGCLENVSCSLFFWESTNEPNFRRPRETPEEFIQKKETLDKILEMRKGSPIDNTARRGPRLSAQTEGDSANSRDPRFIKSEDSDGRSNTVRSVRNLKMVF